MDFTFIIPSDLLVLNIKRLDEGAVAGLLLLYRKRKSEKGHHISCQLYQPLHWYLQIID